MVRECPSNMRKSYEKHLIWVEMRKNAIFGKLHVCSWDFLQFEFLLPPSNKKGYYLKAMATACPFMSDVFLVPKSWSSRSSLTSCLRASDDKENQKKWMRRHIEVKAKNLEWQFIISVLLPFELLLTTLVCVDSTSVIILPKRYAKLSTKPFSRFLQPRVSLEQIHVACKNILYNGHVDMLYLLLTKFYFTFFLPFSYNCNLNVEAFISHQLLLKMPNEKCLASSLAWSSLKSF